MGVRKRFSKSLMTTWFREIDVIDDDNIPSDRGSVFVSWHSGGLFDKMLTQNLLNVELVYFDGNLDDQDELEQVASAVSSGKSVVVFPEGESHDSPRAIDVKDCAARIALRAKELSQGFPPVVIPIGIHYSQRFRFRERVALTIERPIEISGSVDELSAVIAGEISRASLSSDEWKDRELIWKARSIIHAERVRRDPDLELRTSYGEGVIGARRVRAAWEWLAIEDPDKCKSLESRTRRHMSEIRNLGLEPRHIDARPESVTLRGFINSIWWWLFAWSFMLGFVTWSAMLGSILPYALTTLVDRKIGCGMDSAKRGAFKLHTAFVLYPIWWLIAASLFTWVLVSDQSPIAFLAKYSLTIDFLFSIPAFAIFPIMIWWMPTSAKLQIKLYTKGTLAWRRMRLWVKWRDRSLDWDALVSSQRKLAADLVAIGDNLILPGDQGWIDPEPGKDDHTMVKIR